MNEAARLIARMTPLGVTMRAIGFRLIVDAPAGVITPEMRTDLSRHKANLIALLGTPSDLDRKATCTVAKMLATAYQKHRAARGIPLAEDLKSAADAVAFPSTPSVHGGARP